MTTRAEPVLKVVEYIRVGNAWRPHSIITDRGVWDACWSRRSGGLLVHESSNCGIYADRAHSISKLAPNQSPWRIWVADGVPLTRFVLKRGAPLGEGRERPVTTDAALRRLGWIRLTKRPADPFKDAMIVDGHIEYCTVCEDYMDDMDLCEHLVWSDEACQPVGVGAVDSMEGTMPESFVALCTRLGVDGTQRLHDVLSLRTGWSRDDVWDTIYDLRREFMDCEIAAHYVTTLSAEAKVRRAVGETKRRLNEWLAQANEARAS
jgi:hypothetical protein